MSMDDLKAKKVAAPAIIVNPTPESPEKDGNQYSNVSPKAELEAEMARLDRLEKTTGSSGAVPLMPKRMLLDASDVVKTHPDKRIRWVNVGNKEKAEHRENQGYERVPVSEGGRQVGNLALFALSREVYEQRVADMKRIHKARLNAHKTEVEQMAEAVAKDLRDKHGIRVDASRIIIKD